MREPAKMSPFELPWLFGQNQLQHVFQKAGLTNSYKLFWFWALLDISLKADDFVIPLEDLAIEMVVKAWYPYHFFKLDFGTLDQLAKIIEEIKEHENLEEDIREDILRERLASPERSKATVKMLKKLLRYVPYRFLLPWVGDDLRGIVDAKRNQAIVDFTKENWRKNEKPIIYKFVEEKPNAIRVQYSWMHYMREHHAILKDFTLFHLAGFIQGRNPNVPNILNKLEYKPAERDQLTARKLWQPFLELHPDTRCIYTGQAFDRFAIDHFLPWSFVAHNDIWNTVPIPMDVNSRKGNMLPSAMQDLDNFVATHVAFFRFLNTHNLGRKGRSKEQNGALEQYSLLFRDELDSVSALSDYLFSEGLKERIAPLITAAKFQRFREWVR